jgi:hypothetical protein
MDVIDKTKNTLWEIKCTSQTEEEHIIQLAIYAWMINTYKKETNEDKMIKEYKLLNVCNDEVVILLYNHEKITSMLDYLLKSKYEKKKVLTDTEFINQCLNKAS